MNHDSTLLVFTSGFFSTPNPFDQDSWVAGNSRVVAESEFDRAKFASFVTANSILPRVLETIIDCGEAVGQMLCIDGGGFMGTFSVAARMAAYEAGLNLSTHVYEANSDLYDGLRSNVNRYSVEIFFHKEAISEFSGFIEFGSSPGNSIGGSALSPRDKAGETGAVRSVPAKSLADVLPETYEWGLVKLDIEGVEHLAFRSVEESALKLRNVFIVEYAPWQGSQMMGEGTYSEFLLRNFEVFNIGNWLYTSSLERREISNEKQLLEDTVKGNREYNTDLLLLPRD